LLFSLVQELVNSYDPTEDPYDGELSQILPPQSPGLKRWHCFLVQLANGRIILYNTFVERVEELRLPAVINAKPILNVSCRESHWYRVAESRNR
jgi:hypothetical protein